MNTKEYLESHGITQKTVDNFGLEDQGFRIVIPIKGNEGVLLFNKYRNLNHAENKNIPKFNNSLGSQAALFNIQALYDGKPYVVITEGEFDAMRLLQEGFSAVSSTGGVGTFKEEWFSDFPLNKLIIINYDNDEPGKEGAKSLATEFVSRGFVVKIVHVPDGEGKDICDYLKNHSIKDFNELVKDAEIFKADTLTEDVKEEDYPPPFKSITLTEIYNTEFPEEEYIVDKLIPEEGIVGIVGDAGSFKSLFTQYLVRCLLSKKPVLDQFDVKKDCNILFIDKENRLRRTKKRLQALGVAASDRVRYIASPELFNLDNEEFNKFVADEVKEYEINLLFIDSFVDIFTGKESDSGDTGKALDQIKQLAPNGTIILIHHSGKPVPRLTRSALHQTRGSTNIAAQFESQFYFAKTKSNKIFTIEQGKARDAEPLKKFSVEIVYGSGGPITDLIYKGEVENDEDLLEVIIEKIVEIVGENPGIDRETLFENIETETGCTQKNFQSGLTQAKKQKFIRSEKKKGYGNSLFYYLAEEQEGEDG